MYKIYCDGACLHDQKSKGVGGYGYVIIDTKSKSVHENSGRLRNKTSNQMEILAVIASLKDVYRLSNGGRTAVVEVWTDSAYVSRNWQENFARWLDNGWQTKKGKDISNRVCWELLLDMAHRFSYLTIKWCRGHSDNKYQNRAHDLSQEAKKYGSSDMSKKPKCKNERGLRTLLPGDEAGCEKGSVCINPGSGNIEGTNPAGTDTSKPARAGRENVSGEERLETEHLRHGGFL